MNKSNAGRSVLIFLAILSILAILRVGCGGAGAALPVLYQYDSAISTMGGSYSSMVIPVHYLISVGIGRDGVIPVGQGYGNIAALFEYSLDNSQSFHICHDTENKTQRQFTFTEAPSIQEATFNWDVDADLGSDTQADSCVIRLTIFHNGANPYEDPLDIQTTTEFSINQTSGSEIVCGEPPEIISGDPPYAIDGEIYIYVFDAIKGHGELRWSLDEPIDDKIVSGLTLSSNGMLYGKPVVTDEYKSPKNIVTFHVSVEDSCPDGIRRDSHTFELYILDSEIDCAPIPTFTEGQTLPLGREGISYNHRLSYTGGEGILSFTVVNGSLPTGLSVISNTRNIYGTPAEGTAGQYVFTIRVTDSCIFPQSDEVELTLDIIPFDSCGSSPVIKTNSIPQGKQNSEYSFQVTATGGEGELYWTGDGNYPAGLSISEDGLISGIPTEFGLYEIGVSVEDSCLVTQTDSKSFELKILDDCNSPLIITSTTLTRGVLNRLYSRQMTATGGRGPLHWSGDDNFPDGMSIDENGLISGFPQEFGAFEIEITVTDSCSITQTDTIVVELVIFDECEQGPTLVTSALPNGKLYYPYSFKMIATGGDGELFWSSDDNFPDGLSLSVDGLISGAPMEEGIFLVKITVTDSCEIYGPQYMTRQFQLMIGQMCESPPQIITETLNNPAAGEPYTRQLDAENGDGNLSWSLENGELPDGLHISHSGLLAGIVDCSAPSGDYYFTVKVCDSCIISQCDTKDLNFFVSPPRPCFPLVIGPNSSIPDFTVMIYRQYAIQMDGWGYGDLTWVMIGGTLPDGLQFDDGKIFGRPEPGTQGDYDFTIRVVDECPCYTQPDQITLPLHVEESDIGCYESQPVAHRFCMECMTYLHYGSDENAYVNFNKDPFEELPVRFLMEISYDNTKVSINETSFEAGPVIPYPQYMSFEITSDRIIITYNPLDDTPLPISESGRLLKFKVYNENTDYYNQYTELTIDIPSIRDISDNELEWESRSCSFEVAGTAP